MTLQEVAAHFPGGRWRSGTYETHCPCHDDRKSSLGLSVGQKGGVVVCCQAGCDTRAILSRGGLQWADLQPPSANGRHPTGAETVYRYDDENGEPLYEVHRTADKKFFARRPGERSGGIEGVRRVLYQLPLLLKTQPGDTICVVEGEKDVHTLLSLGIVATTSPGGASKAGSAPKWKDDYTSWLKARLPGRRFVILPDNDEAGIAHGQAVFRSLKAAGLAAFILTLPDLAAKEDVSDWLRTHSPDDLRAALADPTPFVASVAAKKETETPFALAPEALYGWPGDAVKAIAPHTESCDAAILASLLVGAGVLIGRGPHVYRDGAQHGVNEFACLVGLSAVGRKGTATRRAEEIFEAVGVPSTNSISQYDISILHDMRAINGGYWRSLVLSGLGSGEALIAALAAAGDANPCPRRLVFEEEFSKALKVMGREGSVLSETLRAAWDGSPLANVTKGRSLRAPASHVAILAHVTETEMRLRLGAAELFNGFANRFLWFATQRARSLPFGGGEAPLAPVVSRLRRAIQSAQKSVRLDFDAGARRIWGDGGVYERLVERPAGLLGAVTSRAASHVTRLALLYAVLDQEEAIRVPHLLAALAVWDYNERSCAFLFGESSGDEYADTIRELLEDVYPGCLSRTEIRDRFARHAAPGRIPKALATLESEGRAERTVVETGGRPVEFWTARMQISRDRSDKSPLSMAREMI